MKSIALFFFTLLTLNCFGAGISVSTTNGMASGLTLRGVTTNQSVTAPSAGLTNVIAVDSTGKEIALPFSSVNGGNASVATNLAGGIPEIWLYPSNVVRLWNGALTNFPNSTTLGYAETRRMLPSLVTNSYWNTNFPANGYVFRLSQGVFQLKEPLIVTNNDSFIGTPYSTIVESFISTNKNTIIGVSNLLSLAPVPFNVTTNLGLVRSNTIFALIHATTNQPNGIIAPSSVIQDIIFIAMTNSPVVGVWIQGQDADLKRVEMHGRAWLEAPYPAAPAYDELSGLIAFVLGGETQNTMEDCKSFYNATGLEINNTGGMYCKVNGFVSAFSGNLNLGITTMYPDTMPESFGFGGIFKHGSFGTIENFWSQSCLYSLCCGGANINLIHPESQADSLGNGVWISGASGSSIIVGVGKNSTPFSGMLQLSGGHYSIAGMDANDSYNAYQQTFTGDSSPFYSLTRNGTPLFSITTAGAITAKGSGLTSLPAITLTNQATPYLTSGGFKTVGAVGQVTVDYTELLGTQAWLTNATTHKVMLLGSFGTGTTNSAEMWVNAGDSVCFTNIIGSPTLTTSYFDGLAQH
jgi:hypothetical protein